ncbi:MAG: hypothetical protein ACT4OX_02050 [Actinomycetota bacterium]
MDTSTWIVICILAALALGALGTGLVLRRTHRQQRSDRLRDRFGPEYGRADEGELEDRLARYERAPLRSLDAATLQDCITRWAEVQADVIDWPTRAAVRAQRLLDDVMVARGFPVEHNERVAMLSVLAPSLIDDYRGAHVIAVRALDGVANTEECRQALLRVRRLFDGLLGEPDHAAAPTPTRERLDLRTKAGTAQDVAERADARH